MSNSFAAVAGGKVNGTAAEKAAQQQQQHRKKQQQQQQQQQSSVDITPLTQAQLQQVWRGAEIQLATVT